VTGWKQWLSGEVVEHTDFQTYLQDQVVQTYAGTAARSSALGTAVSEGMVSYLEDSNTVQVYDGSAWFTLAPTAGTVAYATLAGTADFANQAGTATFANQAGTASYATLAGTADYATLAGTAVTISGSITSGQVSGTAVTLADTGTVTNAMLAGSIENAKLVNSSITLNGTAVALGGSATIEGGGGGGFTNPMTSVGDLIVGTTAGAASRLGIGSAGQYLFSNGSTASWNSLGTATTISGNIAPTQVTAGTFNAGSFAFSTAVTTGNTLTTGNAMRNITMSTATPTGGADGDVWLQYTP
jgi:hypothetical protein